MRMAKAPAKEPYGEIHHFYLDKKGNAHLDEDGEPMIGFYYQMMDGKDQPISSLVGPYHTMTEASTACNKAWLKEDY